MRSGSLSRSESDGDCSRCGDPLTSRPAAPYPVALQIIFAGSFVVFLIVTAMGPLPKPVLWAWTAVQIVLGALVIRARKRAQGTVFRCNRCDTDLP